LSDEHADSLHLLEQRQHDATLALESLDRFGRIIHTNSDQATLFQHLYEEASQLMALDRLIIALLLPNGTHLQIHTSIEGGIEGEPQPPMAFHPEGPVAQTLQSNEMMIVNNPASEFPERFPAASSTIGSAFFHPDTVSWMGAPILRYSDVIGIVIAQSNRADAYNAREARLLKTLAGMLAIAMAQGELLGKLTNTRMALSVPLIPLSDRHLLLTLIGVLDNERMTLIQETLLHTIQGSRYRIVMISLTAIQTFDESGLAAMVKMTRAVELLGARCVLAGISADFSLKLVDAGADLSRLQVFPSLLRALQTLGLAT
jgi:anti-anti-sigma regulatory factor